MRDWMMLGAMCLFVPLALRNTYCAFLLWGWAGLIAIHTFMYGFMRTVPYVQVFAILALLLLMAGKDPERRRFEPDGTTILMIVFGVHITLAAALAYPGVDRNWELCTNVLKTLLFCLVMPMLVTSRLRIHAFVVMLALAAGFHGLIEGLKFVSSGGAHLSQGNVKLGDRNHFAVMVAMIMPILLYLYSYANNSLARLGYLGVLVVNILAVIATRSRAGLLTLIAVAVWYVLQGRRKIVGIFAMVVVGIGVIAVAPPEWTNRMETIKTADDDSSFMGRVMAWKRGSAIALENPVFGGGFHSVQAPSIFEQFRYKQGILGFIDTPEQSYPAAAHSIYFEVLGDIGFVGLFLFLAILASAFVNRIAINRLVKPFGDELLWARDLANALAACILAYAVGGASISAAYFEMPYLVVMLAAVLQREVATQVLQSRPGGRPLVPEFMKR